MADFITQAELNTAIYGVFNYLLDKNIDHLRAAQTEIKKAKEIDFAIKTYAEFELKEAVVPSSHGVDRMAVILLNSYGEGYFDRGTLRIIADDPKSGYADHTNTYTLVLKDAETHYQIHKGNPTGKDKPYDFDTSFLSQITEYKNGKQEDTTDRAWDSFHPGYHAPSRKLDFKSALWKKNHEHFVDYIIQILDTGEVILFQPGKKTQPKQIVFNPVDTEHVECLKQYLNLLKFIRYFDIKNYDLSWDKFILPEEPK